MKRILLYISLAWILLSCENIPADRRYVEVPPEQLKTNRVTLLCEFSGLSCVNCPEAVEVAHRMLEMWPDRLVVVEMHPPSNPLTNSKNPAYDYTCPAADVYYKHFGGTPTSSLPTGIINLQGEFTPHQLWSSAFIRSDAAQTNVSLAATVDYNPSTREMHAEVTLTNMDLRPQDLQLVAWLTEDSIVGAQRFPSGTRTDYVHNHLLREVLTPEWGVALNVSTVATNRLDYTLPERYQSAHCHLVLLALRDEEVVQAVQVNL